MQPQLFELAVFLQTKFVKNNVMSNQKSKTHDILN